MAVIVTIKKMKKIHLEAHWIWTVHLILLLPGL